ncbi:hypothetical protein [uncultured Ruminococcus sp.]|uniref:hypothetical protein n=1 Tax=uncultured Ruminococcus sp. TaxID=165186 RepID=UPI0025E268A2|nr:hypothetical protein [uncultured Ruminococcus sp.]
MKNKLKRTTSMLCALTVAAVPMTMSAFTASATEITNTVSDYTLTIPSSFTVANAGWNKIEGGVTASGTLADGKKLVVTAQSDNGWALKSGDNSIGYNLAKAEADYNANAEVPTWEFDTLTADGVSQGAGLIVDNYDEAPAGNYSDNVVFTASVEDAIKTLTLTGHYFNDFSPEVTEGGECSFEIEYTDNDTWNDIVERYDELSLDDYNRAPDGKIIMLQLELEQGLYNFELKSEGSTHNYNLVSINDKVSAYDSYFLYQS